MTTYTQESLWESIFSIIPGFRIAKQNNCYLNLPSCVRVAAGDFFIYGIEGKESEAAIVKQAMLDIATKGEFSFESAPNPET